MAFIPSPIEHDLFLSYAHEDRAWVTSLQEQLTARLIDRLGGDCDIWQDKNKLRTGQNFPDELKKAVRASAAFIAVLSRNYQGATWCERELDAFLEETSEEDRSKTGGYDRVLKVIKFPWLLNAHEGFLRGYQHVSFFDCDPNTGQEREFKPTSEAFRRAVDRLSFHIEKLFEAMLRNREKVFVARVAGDAVEERGAIVAEIRAAGYALSPPPEGAIPRGLDRRTLKRYISEARATIHLLGESSDPGTREQIDLALEADKKVIFYLTRGHELATGEQKTLIDDIRENKWKLTEGKWHLLGSRDQTVRRKDLIALLAPPRQTVKSEADNAAHVYLVCDPSSAEDAAFSRELQGKIRDVERFHVETPQAATDSFSSAQQHERLLQESDGILLYHEKAPNQWYRRNFADLLMAEYRRGARELKSKALLIGASDTALPGLTVIQRRDPFELQQLEPFLAPLRGVRGRGGAANAAG